ncbi:MAG: thioredoxin-dependent thiol peroxidase [Anaerolineales bacterium]
MMVLEAGLQAPDFELPDENGVMHRLSDFAGKNVVLYFYPKDDTPGCTTEACSFRDQYHVFEELGIPVIGVSPDSPKRHSKFKEKYSLPFLLLSDEKHTVLEAYGVWGQKKMMGKEYDGVFRTTYLIGKDQKILKVFKNVKPDGHSQEILQAINELSPDR